MFDARLPSVPHGRVTRDTRDQTGRRTAHGVGSTGTRYDGGTGHRRGRRLKGCGPTDLP